MKNKTFLTGILGSAIMLLTSSPVFAGAGANIYACIYMDKTPQTPMVANVTAGGSGTHCMNDTGNSTTIKVSSAGLNCSSVGYVEEKASSTKGDTCATDTSHWPLSYNINGQPYSGYAMTRISRPGSQGNIKFENSTSPKTSVCTAQALCVGTSATWDVGTRGPLYIIFQPQDQ